MTIHPIAGEVSVEASAQEHSVRAAARKVRTSSSSYNPDVGSQISGLLTQYAPLGYMLPWEVLDYVELLATYNPDYSQAVENIKMLANSGHELYVEAKSKLKEKKIKAYLDEKARLIQEQHGGIDGLIDKLLDQGAVYGAMCGEWILNEDLTDVVDFVDVNPKLIRFFWEEEGQKWAPYQKVSALQAREAAEKGQTVRQYQYVKLNEITFRYYAFDAAPGSPYGTPPFLAALQNIAIQRDMVNNLAQIVKKIGLLGIIDLTIKPPAKQIGETDAAYVARLTQYLDDYVTVAEDMVKDGGLVHFDDVEAKSYNINGNAAGAMNIFKGNEELVFSGLKSMPSVQGRSYSTTETYAGVAYEIIIRNTLKYQRGVKRMIESGYWLIATLRGDQPDSIKLNFKSNKTLHRLNDATAHNKEIMNALMKWAAGFIDQQGAAQELGYSSPKTSYSDLPSTPILNTGNEDSSEATGSETATEEGSNEEPEGEREPEEERRRI